MKNNDTHLSQKIILAYYGELSEEEQKQFDAQLAHDAGLAQRVAVFKQSFERIKHADAEEPGERYWNYLERNIIKTAQGSDLPTSAEIPASTRRSWWLSFRELFLSPQRIGFSLAGALVFTLMGMYVGSELQNEPKLTSTQQSVAESLDNMPGTTGEKVSDFLKRSQIYFATSVDHEVLCEKCQPIREQLPNRQIARDLLKEASTLKTQAKSNPEIQKLITDIEFVLDNIENNSQINEAQAEVVHHIASNAVCEVAARIDSANMRHQNQTSAQTPK